MFDYCVDFSDKCCVDLIIFACVENCIDRHLDKHANQIALIWEKDEPGSHEVVTYRLEFDTLYNCSCPISILVSYCILSFLPCLQHGIKT